MLSKDNVDDAELELKNIQMQSWSLSISRYYNPFTTCCDRDPFKKGDLKEATAHLYAAMHRLDNQKLDLIIAQRFPDTITSIND
jgi:hypothetical protein